MMKIVRLSAENVKRIQAIEVTPEGTLITVGGKNGAGKSSVLDSIAYALGGQSLVPAAPIRKGETEAKIEVDLGDYVVIRRFSKKDKATTSTLVVKNKDGATYPSPQAVLDRLLGKLTFDPLEFARAKDETTRRSILASLIDVDTSLFDAKRKAAFDRRTAMNRDKKSAEAQFAATTHFADTPDEEVSIADLSLELEAAENKGKDLSVEKAKQYEHQEHVKEYEKDLAAVAMRLEAAEKQLVELQKKLKEDNAFKKMRETQLTEMRHHFEGQKEKVEALAQEMPDTAAIRARLSEADATNRKVRANQKREELRAKVDDLEKKVEAETLAIEQAEAEKVKALEEAKYPIPGLGLNDDGVTFNGLPFEQAAKSEQLTASVAIGLAMNPTLKVLLIRDGNVLDSDSLKAIAAQAAAADAQIWMEWVTESKDGVSVMIEDGAVAQ